MKFRKKPVVIDAMQYKGVENKQAIIDFTEGAAIPQYGYLIIKTLEGDYKADIGDWIIKGIKGEFYPCKPGIFEKTYDKV